MKTTWLTVVICGILLTACGTSGNGGRSAAGTEKGYNCIGTEPFWNVKIEAAGITFHLMGEDPLTYPYKAARKQDTAQVYETTSKGSRLKVSITEEGCSDGMSDAHYPYKVTVEKDGTTYQGCAFLLGKNPMQEER